MDDRSRVRPNGDFVSGDPQSEPDTQDLPPTPAFGAQNGFPDRRLERHHGEDVGGGDAIGVRLRLGDNPVADAAADMRAVTTAVRRSGITPHWRGEKGAVPPSATSTGARRAGGSKGGREPALASPGVLHGVGWLDALTATNAPSVGRARKRADATRGIRLFDALPHCPASRSSRSMNRAPRA